MDLQEESLLDKDAALGPLIKNVEGLLSGNTTKRLERLAHKAAERSKALRSNAEKLIDGDKRIQINRKLKEADFNLLSSGNKATNVQRLSGNNIQNIGMRDSAIEAITAEIKQSPRYKKLMEASNIQKVRASKLGTKLEGTRNSTISQLGELLRNAKYSSRKTLS
jgi:hypothetical protein